LLIVLKKTGILEMSFVTASELPSAAELLADEELFYTMEWDTERFGVGIKFIDDQHKHLISIVNNLCRLRQQAVQEAEEQAAAGLQPSSSTESPLGRKKRVVPMVSRFLCPGLQRGSPTGQLIDDLVTYCAKHLAYEEYILETYGYQDRLGHNQEHEQFAYEIGRAHKLMEEFNFENSDLAYLVYFLKYWLKSHIPKDRRFAPLLLEKGLGI
jgi:hemerythrin-like metal-binding protein